MKIAIKKQKEYCENNVSILPKRVLRGSIVTIHLGLLNKCKTLKIPYVEVSIIEPNGAKQPLFEDNIVIPPNYKKSDSRIKRKQRMLNNFFHFNVKETSLLGRYRVKIEIFDNGKLVLSDSVEDDFFYVEEVKTKYQDEMLHVNNLGPETVPLKIFEKAANGRIHEKALKCPAEGQVIHKTKENACFITYANSQLKLVSSPFSPIVVQNQEFFWRHEDIDTIFALDTGMVKRSFFMSGSTRELFLDSSGGALKNELIKKHDRDTYRRLIQKELLKEVNT